MMLCVAFQLDGLHLLFYCLDLFISQSSLPRNTVKQTLIKDTRKALDYFKSKQQKCMNQCFLICKCAYILKVYSTYYTLTHNKNVTSISFGQNPLFFVSRAPTYHSFYFKFAIVVRAETQGLSLSNCVLDSPFSIPLYFRLTNSIDCLTLKRHNSVLIPSKNK